MDRGRRLIRGESKMERYRRKKRRNREIVIVSVCARDTEREGERETDKTSQKQRPKCESDELSIHSLCNGAFCGHEIYRGSERSELELNDMKAAALLASVPAGGFYRSPAGTDRDIRALIPRGLVPKLSITLISEQRLVLS